jgi:hypothetical protein
LYFITYITGINAGGIRSVIQAPNRYAIPLIVSTGLPYSENGGKSLSFLDQDNLGTMDDRYRMDELFYGDSLGSPLPQFDWLGMHRLA